MWRLHDGAHSARRSENVVAATVEYLGVQPQIVPTDQGRRAFREIRDLVMPVADSGGRHSATIYRNASRVSSLSIGVLGRGLASYICDVRLDDRQFVCHVLSSVDRVSTARRGPGLPP
jgi:hypothetical protein